MEISNLERYCIDASHLQEPSTNRFFQANGKQPMILSFESSVSLGNLLVVRIYERLLFSSKPILLERLTKL